MPLIYSKDVLAELKKAGFNTNRIRQEGLLSQSTLQKFRTKQGVDWKNIERVCELLNCQPGYFIEYISENTQGGISAENADKGSDNT